MTRSTYLPQAIILSFLLSICSIPFATAATLDENRNNAKGLYFSGELDSSFSLFITLAESGDAESQYYIGLIYLTEDWPGKNVEKALAYLTTAADQNSAEAMWKIGEVYENGWGGNKNLLTALDWYRKSKRSELKKSHIRFMKVNNGKANLLENSVVVEGLIHDAKNGNREAEFKLANIYDEGKLVNRNMKKALYWYEKAAINKHNYSMLMMGYFLCRGIGVEFDKEKANDWLEKSGRNTHCN